MGERLITDYQFRQLIERLRGIEKEIKQLNAEMKEFNQRHVSHVPPVDPFGYTE